jgi:hypothetical protein
MRKHHWQLVGVDTANAGGSTKLHWKCNHCMSMEKTEAPQNVGDHGAWAYTPSRNLEDCEERLVSNIMES